MRLFDYMFYRMAMSYYKKDGKDAFRAKAWLGLYQIFLFTCLYVTYIRYVSSEFLITDYLTPKEAGAYIWVPIAVLLWWLNTIRYKNWNKELRERWENETVLQKRLGWVLVCFILLLPFIYIFLIGEITHG